MQFVRLKSSEIGQYRDLPVVLPVGAVEQHGLHLPLGTDTLIAEAIMRRVDALMGEHVLLLPAIAIGHSAEHVGFPGTLSIDESTLSTIVTEIATWLEASGFRRLVLVNTHGGNIAPLQAAAANYHGELVIQYYDVDTETVEGKIVELFGGSDWHAGDSESSLLAAILPDYDVQSTTATVHGPDDQFPEEVRSMSQSGVLNHKPEVTVDPVKGHEILELMARELCGFLTSQ